MNNGAWLQHVINLVTKLKDEHFHPQTMSLQSHCSSSSSSKGREARLKNKKENDGWSGLITPQLDRGIY
jgi:hypothetical protein